MPAVHFKIAWPDGENQIYYSPSTVVREHLKPGARYGQAEFQHIIEAALHAASERVRQRFGYTCSAASAELDKISLKLRQLQEQDIDGSVELTAIS
ncbi:MSMEG_0570 family nitrogen starvation response protein [Marinobacter caseinilyticus]|uniref:MSMEG_0570 family nitrogen starvation response protein n=1 Tax=Marinobacter caseinilyticus TaxID=2692195 RepID=UPI00140C8FCA|nr:MSMEG_0570 family nitrogen starvation response protein [Marinobacter caseinilyticus]